MRAIRLSGLSLPAKLTLTAFVLLIAAGYLAAFIKINVWHHDADGVPGMSLDDIRAIYHGMDRTVTTQVQPVSHMLREVSPGGSMRKHLLKGGDPAERALTEWLKQGSQQPSFDRAGVPQPGDPSPVQVIAAHCIKCHNTADGEEEDLPYADSATSAPRYDLVAQMALPKGTAQSNTSTLHIEPMSVRELLHVTHAHMLAIPMFTLAIATLFLLTGLGAGFKLVIAPLPMLACCVDFSCWWLARSFEPAIYGIAAAGAAFGTGLALQMLCILGSMWFGRKATLE